MTMTVDSGARGANMSNAKSFGVVAPAMPGVRDIALLFAGGLAGLLVWQFWAEVITPPIAGGPLQPPGLIISLVKNWTGYELSYDTATILHFLVGIVGYPIAYYVFSRGLKRWALIMDVGVWAIFLAYILVSATQGHYFPFMGIFFTIVTIVSGTRFFNKNAVLADCLSWGSFTWFNALGIMAPLAGLPFLLLDWNGILSFMSYVGHIIYGFVAALVYEVFWGKMAKDAV